MKIYVKDIMPDLPVFWAEPGMQLKDIVHVMVERSFTLLPVRNAANVVIGTVSQRAILKRLGTSSSLNADESLSLQNLDPPLKIVEPFDFLDVVEPDLRRDEAVLVRVGGLPKHLVSTWDLLKILSDLECFRRLLVFEVGLRFFIENRLSTWKGDWWRHLPNDIQEYAKDVGGEGLLALTMDHLRRIVGDNQSAFRFDITDAKVFQVLDGRLMGLRNMRNQLVHGRSDPAELKEKLIKTIDAVDAMLPLRQFLPST